MSPLVKVARYHLVDRLQLVVLPWAVMAFSFVVNLVIGAVVTSDPGPHYTGGVATIYAFVLVLGVLGMTRSLPFGLSLGISRRTYYLGTALTIGALGVVYGLALSVLQVVETVSGGWGLRMHFFRVPWMLDGPWYLTWLTSFVVLVLLYLYGMWYGLVYRRWNVTGLTVFAGAQALVLLAVTVAVSLTGNWAALWSFFGTVTAAGLTGMLAALAVLLGFGGLATIRRVTI